MNLAPFGLWQADAGGAYYLLPDGAGLPAGPCVVRSAAGRVRSLDPTVLADFEVTREQAEAWLRTQVAAMLDAARAAHDLALIHI
jgi:hypothetical protein